VPATPFFSVILPTYGRPELLGRALASLWAQTWQDFEVILVDANPPEHRMRTVPTLQPLLADERLRIVELPSPAVAGGARNAGRAEARGQWIVYQDDDDASRPERLAALQTRIRQEPDCPLLLSALCCHLQARKRVVPADVEELVGEARWTQAFPVTMALCHRREGAPRFLAELAAAEDNYLYYALLQAWRPARVPVVTQPLADIYPQSSAHLEAKQRRLTRGWQRILRDFGGSWPAAVRRHFVLHTVLARYRYHRLDRGFWRYGVAYLRTTKGRGWRYLLNLLLSRIRWGRERVVS